MRNNITRFGSSILFFGLVFSSQCAYAADIFRIEAGKQCSGGTLVATDGTTEDSALGGGAGNWLENWCSELSPQGACCNIVLTDQQDAQGHSYMYHVLMKVYTGATLIDHDVERQGKNKVSYYSAGIGVPAPSAAVTAGLVANPTSIIRGEQSLLSWASTGATTCTGTNFNTNGATSGSLMVSPFDTTTYTVTCTGPGSGSGAHNHWENVGYLPGKCVSETCPIHFDEYVEPDDGWSCPNVGERCQECGVAEVGSSNAVIDLYECTAGGALNSASASATVTVTAPDDDDDGDGDGGGDDGCALPHVCVGNDVVDACTGAVIDACATYCMAGSSTIDARCSLTPGQCVAGNICVGSDQYYRSASCRLTLVSRCAFGCSQGVCINPKGAAPELSLTAHPPLVKSGQSCTLTVSATKVKSCTLKGQGISQTFVADKAGTVTASSVSSPPLVQTTPFTLSCATASFGTVSKTVECKITPTFEEI